MKNLILFGAVACAASSLSGAYAAAKPNVILFNIDDLGWTDMSFQGSDLYETPNIDRLRESSLFFNNAYAAAANSAPSRASMLSGQYAPRHGVYTVAPSDRGSAKARKLIPTPTESVLTSEATTLLETMQTAGYTTCHIGKWHVGKDPEMQGADINIGGSTYGHPKSYFSPYQNDYLEDGEEGEYLTDRLAREAVAFVDKYSKRSNPFFLYYATYSVHTPLQAKPELLAKYKAKCEKLGKSEDMQHFNPQYAAMVEAMDDAVGSVLSYLETNDLMKNTIIIFTSDNGGLYSVSKQWPLRAGKGSFYEGGIRVPMLVHWDGVVEGGSTIETAVSQIDIYPTLMEIAGGELPQTYKLDGESWVSTLKSGKSKLGDRALFWHFPAYLQGGGPESTDPTFRSRPVSVIRKGDWKLIYNYETQTKELYNLKSDPSEREDLATREAKMADKLYGELSAWLKQTGAPTEFELNPKYVSPTGK